ncbi:MAG TPA: UDP-N-acetylmuramoyl-tripeptide--D-alanyl-D-alanine ligase [Gemmatimonadales bacterium]|nr:UDP-N-acetylmuramoyl-tripeptide--D-alanyl-D-alanine ligase [Gemmatimonadales bacterium]
MSGVLATPPAQPCVFSSIATDTRQLKAGALFVALKGPRFDGHDFIAAARAAGATGAVVRRGTPSVGGLAWFEVDDTLAALGRLAQVRRREISGPVLAVTGSNGKTSTKAMLAAALGTRFRTHATRENLNNLIGVPLTILEAPEACEALVIECGASVPGELARLREIVEPSLGVVTNVAEAHLEGFGDLEGVMREKVSLLERVPAAVVGLTPPELAVAARERAGHVITAGLAPEADVHPERWKLDAQGRVEFTLRGHTVRLPVPGRHQGDNAVIACGVAVVLELALDNVAAALADVRLPHGRSELIEADGLVILHDAYNANPASMAAALETARGAAGKRPLVVLVGTMLELGSRSRKLHDQMADRIVAAEPQLIGAVGEFVAAFRRHAKRLGDRLVTARDADELGRVVAARLSGREFVLLKGSRGVQLERALAHLAPGQEA